MYGSDIARIADVVEDGSVVTLLDVRGKPLGSAIYNSRSQIVARRFSRQRQALDADFFTRRFQQAQEYRKRRGMNPVLCRLVWSESDGLPGVIVDRYGDVLVLQTLTLAMDLRLPLILDCLRAVFAPSAIVERNDAPIRAAEGMEMRTGLLWGELENSQIVECLGLQFEVDLLRGHKTGFYLDQVDSYAVVAGHAAGRRVLDCFANQGAFALACAKAGAREVVAVEISEDCAELARRNAQRNSVAVRVECANAFDFLNAAEKSGEMFDLIVLDPPSFTKNKVGLRGAMRGYKEIHLRAFKLLPPGGVLATFSCSHHMSWQLFEEMIIDALVDAKKSVRQLGRLSQAADHPVMPTLPESEYLKGVLLELAPGR